MRENDGRIGKEGGGDDIVEVDAPVRIERQCGPTGRLFSLPLLIKVHCCEISSKMVLSLHVGALTGLKVGCHGQVVPPGMAWRRCRRWYSVSRKGGVA